MEPDIEGQENTGTDTLLGFYGSQELYITESQDGSYYDKMESDVECPLDPQTRQSLHTPGLSPKLHSISEPQLISEPSKDGSKYASSQYTGSMHYEDSGGSNADSHHSIPPPPLLTHAHSTSPDLEYATGQIASALSISSSSSLGSADMTLALTLTPPQLAGAGKRQSSKTGAGARRANRPVGSPKERGCSQAPPAPVSFGISGEGAEQAEKWDVESDRDLCSSARHRRRHARLGHTESQSEKQVKEAKSKCKHIALLLTDAPNSQNKGALLFKRRKQRVKRYTLVSYGTGETQLDYEHHGESEVVEDSAFGYNFLTTSDSEREEEYTVNVQEQESTATFDLNWENSSRTHKEFENVDEMEQLPDTKGKGLMMFAQRRQRMDEISLEHDELRRKGLPVEGIIQPSTAMLQNTYDTADAYMPSLEQYEHQLCSEATDNDPPQSQKTPQLINQVINTVPKPLVPNRTAKPFLGFQNRAPAPFSTIRGVTSPTQKKPDPKFKVPVPVNTNPQVWSPTGDVIASRDERISVPAIKTGILPDSRRRGANKQSAMAGKANGQNQGDRRSFVELGQEEDFLSLGAEACNFMQPRTVRLKVPPPVAPKPSMKLSSPSWTKESPPLDAFSQSRSAHSPATPSPTGHPAQQYLQPQQMANPWASVQTQATVQPSINTLGPMSGSSPPQVTVKSRSPQPSRSPVSMQSSPHPTSVSRNKSANTAKSVASCPQLPEDSCHQAPAGSPKGQAFNRGISPSANGSNLMGRGAELFAKRQSRMERFVVDSDTVQANKTRSPSPSSSLPGVWRYSPNVRAPPPLSYNPILTPFYPPTAAKQPPSTSPKIREKTKAKPKPPPSKHLNTLDLMKHQPYQLDSSLFKYDVNSSSPITSPTPTSEVDQTPKTGSAPSPRHDHVLDPPRQKKKGKGPTRSTGSVSSPIPFALQPTRLIEPLSVDKQLYENPTATPAVHHLINQKALSTHSPEPLSTSWSTLTTDTFSAASLISRGAIAMAPRPKFSAKKPVLIGKQWKPVVLQF